MDSVTEYSGSYTKLTSSQQVHVVVGQCPSNGWIQMVVEQAWDDLWPNKVAPLKFLNGLVVSSHTL